MRSVMTHQFSQVPHADIPRSTFNRSHGHKTTFDAGELIPIFVDEALPGDTFNMNMAAFARIATPIFPIMDNLHLDAQFFSVPIRLIWENWQRFNGEQTTPGASTDFLVPQIVAPAGGFPEKSIYDYMGVPTKVPNLSISALFLRAYNLIYNEWYRDQNLCAPLAQYTGDGPDNYNSYSIQLRGKRHDYFTSALPWPQKGPGVTIPLGTMAPVVPTEVNGTRQVIQFRAGTADATNRSLLMDTGNAMKYGGTAVSSSAVTWGEPRLQADLSQASSATINSLRQAFQIQKIYERDARGGTRYTEIIKAHFGVTSPDARLQRPEYLGGGTTRINFSPVPNTNSDDTHAPQGSLAAYGTAAANGIGFTSSFTEHCILIGIVSVRADLTYQQGLNRMWSRRTRFDFYWPALSHIGEQAVLQKEIFAKGIADDDNDNKVFGYQERYAEYRYMPSRISGLFRSNATVPLDAWHLSQEFANPPVLDALFIWETPPVDRVIAVPSEPHFLFDSFFELRCTRPMPVYGVPGLIDHF